MTEWWTVTQGTWAGAIGGASIGIVAGGLGCLAGFCAPRGKLKGVVVGGLATLTVLGLILLALAGAALMLGQPRHVWYPALLGGGILTLVCGINFPMILLRYRQFDARRLQAAELRRT